jgi:S1-C subfamily serine protease
MRTRPLIHMTGCALIALLSGLPAPALAAAVDSQVRAEQQAMLEEAELARIEAEQARAGAMKAAELAREMARSSAALDREAQKQEREGASSERRQQTEERAARQEEMERAREELSRAHRELREASREIAEAHRALARDSATVELERELNLGDRAVIGVVLGKESAEGVTIVGVSPDGPADRAGLQAGDVLVSIRGESLAGAEGSKGRETLFRVMDEVESGETIAVLVQRDGTTLDYEITAEQREPSSWQTMIRIPDVPVAPSAPNAPPAPNAPHVVVERIEVPHIDHEALNARIEAINKELETKRYLFVSPDGEELSIEEEFVLPEGFDVEIAELSGLAGEALREANIWFGMPYAQGLELAAVNEGLGAYFKTDRGVLVLQARPDNAYQLEAGDVVLAIGSRPVNSPADLMRALREIEPGSEIELTIKRDRKDKTLSVVMPESRLGYSQPAQPHTAPAR